MNSALKVVVGIVAAIVAFMVVDIGFQKYREHAATHELDEKLAQLKADAARNNPNVPTSEAIKQEAIADAGRLLKDAPDEEKRRQTAASTFFGFYLVNMRSRAEYCQDQGVDIQPFTDLFARNHANVLAAARPILATTGYDEDKMYAMLKSQLRQMTEIDMKDIATGSKTDAKGACQLIVTNAEVVADRLQLAKVQPAVYRALMPGG